MTNKPKSFDQFPLSQFDDSYSEEDRQKVMLALSLAKQQIFPNNFAFTSTWLLVPFEAWVWETTNRGREELFNGKWQNTIRIDWRVTLPNGRKLTDAQYETLLTLCKKIAFLSRENLIAGTSAPVAWKNYVFALISLVRWAALHEKQFSPERYGLRLLDQSAIDWLFCLIAKGGWAHALQIPQRLLGTIYIGAHGTACPQALLDKPYTIPSEEIGALVGWLEHEGGYKKVQSGRFHGKRFLRRNLLASIINERPSTFTSRNVSLFLRQFEPDFSEEPLLIGVKQTTELPSHRTISIQDAANIASGEATVEAAGHLIASVLSAHQYVPDLLPEPANISLRRATRIAILGARPKLHTPFMPINIGLAYLNTAMRFVSIYGEAIVGFYLAVLPDYNEQFGNACLNESLSRRLDDWRIASGERLASILNITEFRREEAQPDFDRLRSNPTLDEVLRVLIGSCIVCMALLKPSRENELAHLKRDCLREYAGCYWFNFKLGKSNVGGAWQDEDRPIPLIVALAIHLLQRLGDGLVKIFSENRKIGDNLFYLPKTEGVEAFSASASQLSRHLDIFCDYVGLPPDIQGRRWYLRIHEMRKWFLLLLFWSGRFDVLDAARWIAGHTDAEHIYAYIEKEFPGEGLPELEAEYSVDRMYRREQERMRGKRDAGNEDGIDALYEAVLRHFKVDSLTMVPESEWTAYVLSMRREEKFRLEPHSIYGENGSDVVGLNVSFVMRQVP